LGTTDPFFYLAKPFSSESAKRHVSDVEEKCPQAELRKSGEAVRMRSVSARPSA